MESISGEVTLFDLVAWEPRLQVVPSGTVDTDAAARDQELLTREVDWVMTARATAPMLPHLRGGELIILPQRVIAETDLPFARLVGEIAMQPIAGVLTDAILPSRIDSPIVILRSPRIDADTESTLNRLLSNRRREAIQMAADIDHRIGQLAARNARPGELIDELSRLLRTPVTITAPSGTVSFTTGNSRDVPDPMSVAWAGRSLGRGQHLWIGPIARKNHALVRYTIDRVSTGVQRSLTNSSTQLAPGAARIAALNHLLLDEDQISPAHRMEEALRAGIRPGQDLRVALYPDGTLEPAMHRALRPLGDVLPAGKVDGAQVVILMQQAGPISRLQTDRSTGAAWAAISAPVGGAGELPRAMRQARYIATLISGGMLPRAVTRFDDDQALGAFRLIFEMWGTPLLTSYRDLHIGALVREDTRGILMETLRVYLEQGGSQRQTAEALEIHRNTLGYRLRQIRQALTSDLDAPNTRLTLHLALIAHKLADDRAR